MNDSDIIKYLDKFKIIKWKLLDDLYQNYLINRYNDFYSTEKTNILRESYYRILNNIDVCPICPICGKKRKFSSNRYLNTCGTNKCLAKECQKKREETNIKKYGYKIQFNNPNNYIKVQNAFIRKYGVDNPWKLKEIKDKCKNTIIKNNRGKSVD